MTDHLNPDDEQLLKDMRRLVARRLHAALADESKPARASMLGAAISFLRASGAIDELPRIPMIPTPSRKQTPTGELPFTDGTEADRLREYMEIERPYSSPAEYERLSAQLASLVGATDDEEDEEDDSE